jgi:hypothetical protein
VACFGARIVETLEVSVDLSQAKQVRRLAVAVQYFLKAFDDGYSFYPSMRELRSALEDMKPKPNPNPIPPSSNLVDLYEEKLRLRRKAFIDQ